MEILQLENYRQNHKEHEDCKPLKKIKIEVTAESPFNCQHQPPPSTENLIDMNPTLREISEKLEQLRTTTTTTTTNLKPTKKNIKGLEDMVSKLVEEIKEKDSQIHLNEKTRIEEMIQEWKEALKLLQEERTYLKLEREELQKERENLKSERELIIKERESYDLLKSGNKGGGSGDS